MYRMTNALNGGLRPCAEGGKPTQSRGATASAIRYTAHRPMWANSEPRAVGPEPEARNRKPGTENLEPTAENRNPKVASQEVVLIGVVCVICGQALGLSRGKANRLAGSGTAQ